jgi:hypothetical protein
VHIGPEATPAGPILENTPAALSRGDEVIKGLLFGQVVNLV